MQLSSLRRIRYTMPNADLEYDEAMRYESLQGLSKDEWRALVASGRQVLATAAFLARVGNTTGATTAEAEENYGELEADKRSRVEQQINTGTIELPIVLKDGDTLDLLSGNTRLTALVKAGITPKVLVIDITAKDNNEAL
jgi:hypothetical protein